MTDQATRDSFIAYLGKQTSVFFLVIIIVLGVFSYTLSKAYGKDKNYTAGTKKKVNFIEDIVKGTIFVVMIIFITGFVNENSSKTQIVVAYWIFMISMVLFKILHIIKWYYYCIGDGKDANGPWEKTEGNIWMDD